ncbi:MAG: helicase-related protein [Ignavibacteriaceae bacterium]
MNSKFFTNENENTLLNKFEGIFSHREIYYLDALVGYFRASGYFRIRKYISKASTIRILVGINVDKLVYHANKEGLLFDEDQEKSQEEFYKDVKSNIQQSQYNKEIEDGIIQLIEDISSKKIEIKVHPSKNIHAKIYIFREKEKHDHGYGVVITGSSNLTEAGLERNFEFNVELRDNADIEYATETFEKLWLEGVDLDFDYVDKLKKETYLNDEFTPFEVYMKFLSEYFGKSIEFDPNSISDLPKGFLKLSYQVDAVNDGFNKIMKHNGFFLADVVGLGKTVVATLIAKKFFYHNGFPTHRSHTLIIVPPSLYDNWEETFNKFGVDNYHIVTNGSLHKLKNPEKYDLVIVDEAHKFRTDTAEMYNQLQKLCKTPTKYILPNGEPAKKRVILVSATPLNNRPEDIANQIYLFQDSKDSTLEISNLQNFFRKQIDRYRKAKNEPDIKSSLAEVKKIYEEIRTKVLEQIIVRRTRTDLKDHEQYWDDIQSQNLLFPTVDKPRHILYQLDQELELLYDRTIYYIDDETNGLTYNRYRAVGALKPEKKQKYQSPDLISSQLAKIMKTLLVKRLDSSFYAFKQSLNRFYNANHAMVLMFNKGKIFIAPNLPVTEYILDGKEDELLDLAIEESLTDPTIEICSPDDFIEGFFDGLIKDEAILKELKDKWDTVLKDPKVDEFIIRLKNEFFDKKINYQHKLVIFSESKETTDHLKNELEKNGFTKILCVDSKNRKEKMHLIKSNFDANIKTDEQKDDFNILISTEVLAEGINLHRANIIVNYDTPWNSTRLMQRIGRVNRIGIRAPKIYIYNFFPTAKVDDDIELKKKAHIKLQAFHSALGEDSQIYTTEEEIDSFGLFDKSVEEEKDERLTYLMFLRKFKEENPEYFKKIKNMPLRARVGRKNKILKDSTICFIRNQKRDAFYYCKEDGSLDELTFVESAKQFETKTEEKQIPLHEYHHQQVNNAIKAFSEQIQSEAAKDKKVDTTQGPNEKKALSYLDAFLNTKIVSQEEIGLILLAKKAIRNGRFQNLQRDINKLQAAVKKKSVKPVILLEKLMQILNSYPLQTLIDDNANTTAQLDLIFSELNPEIIISESFSI